jgi:hypothetical protein
MAEKRPPREATEVPRDFPDTEPQELHPTNNIRFVMWETAKLTERVESLTKAIDSLGPAFEKALDKHALDTKERIADLRTEVKDAGVKFGSMKEGIDSFKGAMKVYEGLYALALVFVAAFLAWYLRPEVAAPTATTASPIVTPSGTSGQISN